MNKKKSLAIFIIIGILIIVTGVLGVVKFPIGLYDYHGYAKSIKLGLDLSGGVSAVFDVKTTDDNGNPIDSDKLRKNIEGVVGSMQDLLVSKGYTESVVSYDMTGAPTITVEVPNVEDPKRIFDLIGRPASLKITKGGDADKVYIIGKDHLEDVGISPDPEYPSRYAVSLKFNKAGTTAFATATSENLNGTVDFYINEEKYMSVNVKSAITDGKAIIQSSQGGYTYDDAYALATRLQSGTFGVDLTIRSNNIISPTLGDNAIRNSVIAGVIGLVFILVFMFIVYRNFGLMANIALLIYIELLLILCAALPWVQLTLPGIAGIVLGIGMAVDANIIIFERIKDEYREGKTIPTAIDIGFKKASIAVIDANITTLIGAIVLWIFGGPSIVGFAVTLFISIIVSMFTALVVTRGLIKMLLPFNSTNPVPYNLKREGVVNE